jgi:hypothetical protein
MRGCPPFQGVLWTGVKGGKGGTVGRGYLIPGRVQIESDAIAMAALLHMYRLETPSVASLCSAGRMLDAYV